MGAVAWCQWPGALTNVVTDRAGIGANVEALIGRIVCFQRPPGDVG